jgi:hypothetical protein
MSKMDHIEPQIKNLLNGGGIQTDTLFCDFSLTDQNEVLGELLGLF